MDVVTDEPLGAESSGVIPGVFSGVFSGVTSGPDVFVPCFEVEEALVFFPGGMIPS